MVVVVGVTSFPPPPFLSWEGGGKWNGGGGGVAQPVTALCVAGGGKVCVGCVAPSRIESIPPPAWEGWWW